MAKQISNLAVKLSANIAGFMTGFAKAGRQLKSFGSDVAGTASRIAGITAAITAAATGGGLLLLLKSQAEAIDSSAKFADRVGMSTESLVGLQHAASLADVSTEQLEAGIGKMLNTLGQAVTEGGATAKVFESMGMSAEELANMPTDKAFAAIAENLAGIKNPAERARKAVAIFGKAGQELLPMMLDGAKGLQAAQEGAAKLGLTFSRIDAAKVEAANDSMTRLKAVAVGIGRTLAIQLAPFVDAIATKLTGVATSGEGMGVKVVNAFEWVLTAIAKSADWLNLLVAGWHTLRGVAASALGGLLQGIGAVTAAMEWLYKKLGIATFEIGESTFALGQALEAEAKDAFKKAGESWDDFMSGKNAAAVKATFAEIRANAQKAAEDIANRAKDMAGGAIEPIDGAEKRLEKLAEKMASIREKIATYGMSDMEKELRDLAALGAPNEWLAEAQEGLTKLANAEEAKKKLEDLKREAEQVKDSIKTPMREYGDSIGKLDELLSNNLLTWDEYAAAVRKARQELEKTSKTRPELMRADSAEAMANQFEASVNAQLAKPIDTSRMFTKLVPKQNKTVKSIFAKSTLFDWGDGQKRPKPKSNPNRSPFAKSTLFDFSDTPAAPTLWESAHAVGGKTLEQRQLTEAQKTARAVESMDRKMASEVTITIGG